MPKQKNKSHFLKHLIFFLGLALCVYPIISSLIQRQHQKNAVATYQSKVVSADEVAVEQMLASAKEYNDTLYQSRGLLIGDAGKDILSKENYEQVLNMNGDGIIASIEIPKIDVVLPIYHGTSEEMLSVGAGHVEGTSLPVGGANTRAIITAHRGLPNAKLFTRLDELERGDYFFIQVLGNTLAYEVSEIEVIEPENTEEIQVIPEKDMVSLLTCTPYGINTHRLVVTGERTDYREAFYEQAERKMMSFREMVFLCIPVVFLCLYFLTGRIYKRKREVNKGE